MPRDTCLSETTATIEESERKTTTTLLVGRRTVTEVASVAVKE